jgi:hypothetical protein
MVPFVRLLAAVVVVTGVLGALHGAVGIAPEPDGRQIAPIGQSNAEHRYRIAGKVRMLFFWVSADDVGGARITWSGGEQDRSLALLIGSDPRRAPRGVNEWGYVREHVAGDAATVFGIRTVTDGDSPDQADGRRTAPGHLTELGVLCSRVSPLDAATRTTSVYVGRDTTYRDVDQVIDAAAVNVRWNGFRTIRPAGASPGFLTAMDLLMRSATSPVPSVSYVYKDAVFDLIVRRVERVPSLRTRGGRLHNLLRSEILVRNRTTGLTTGFKITYGTDGALAGVPVAATYQPNWWFKVELELDDDQEVPPEPAADPVFRGRIAVLCSASDASRDR